MTDEPTPNSDPRTQPSDPAAATDPWLAHSAMPPSTALPPTQSLTPDQPFGDASLAADSWASPLHQADVPPAPPPSWQTPPAPQTQAPWATPQPPTQAPWQQSQGQSPWPQPSVPSWQQPQAPSGPAFYPYPQARSSNGPRVLILLAVLIAVAALVGALVLIGQPRAGGTSGATGSPASSQMAVSADSTIKPDAGASIYSDDFMDSESGWTTDTASSGTTYKYTTEGYVVGALGDLHHFIYSPPHHSRQQLSMTVTAKETAAPAGAGFGVSCRRGSGVSMLSYEFLLFADGSWAVERRNGAPDVNTGPETLEEGAGNVVPGSTPTTVQGVCATVDATTTRLVLFVNGSLVKDTSDTSNEMSTTAWLGGLDISSRSSAGQTVTITHYEERDLSE